MKFPTGQNHPCRILYKNYLRLIKPLKSNSFSRRRIDILIPVAEKDLESLPLVVECARKNIINPIDNIFIVGKIGIIDKNSKELGCTFIDENSFLPIKKADIIYKGKEWHRSGWLFQQLIKLNANAIAQNEFILVLDSDTCISKRQTFLLEDNSVILNFSDEYHLPYGNYNHFLNLDKRFYLSFVCHHMIFSKKILKTIQKDIEFFTQQNWVQGILNNIDFEESCCFSEYEIYGNYIYANYPGTYHLEYWNNKKLTNGIRFLYDGIYEKYKTVSFHKYF